MWVSGIARQDYKINRGKMNLRDGDGKKSRFSREGAYCDGMASYSGFQSCFQPMGGSHWGAIVIGEVWLAQNPTQIDGSRREMASAAPQLVLCHFWKQGRNHNLDGFNMMFPADLWWVTFADACLWLSRHTFHLIINRNDPETMPTLGLHDCLDSQNQPNICQYPDMPYFPSFSCIINHIYIYIYIHMYTYKN